MFLKTLKDIADDSSQDNFKILSLFSVVLLFIPETVYISFKGLISLFSFGSRFVIPTSVILGRLVSIPFKVISLALASFFNFSKISLPTSYLSPSEIITATLVSLLFIYLS